MSNKKTEKKKVAYLVVGTIGDAAKTLIDGLIADKTFEVLDVDALNNEHKLATDGMQVIIDQLKSSFEESETQRTDLQTKVTRLTEELGNLSSELGTAQQAADNGFQTVKSGKKTYRVHGKKWRFDGRDITIDDLKKEAKLVEALLKLEVGFLVELNEKEG